MCCCHQVAAAVSVWLSRGCDGSGMVVCNFLDRPVVDGGSLPVGLTMHPSQRSPLSLPAGGEPNLQPDNPKLPLHLLRLRTNSMSRLQDNDRIIIIGGGVIGLSTAYNLPRLPLPGPEILVIEASDACFSASSSNCTGCLHYAFRQPLLPLGKYSFDLWEAESADQDFTSATGYRAQSSFGISTGTGKGLDGLPGWVSKDSTWDVDSSVLGARTATVFVLRRVLTR